MLPSPDPTSPTGISGYSWGCPEHWGDRVGGYRQAGCWRMSRGGARRREMGNQGRRQPLLTVGSWGSLPFPPSTTRKFSNRPPFEPPHHGMG